MGAIELRFVLYSNSQMGRDGGVEGLHMVPSGELETPPVRSSCKTSILLPSSQEEGLHLAYPQG